MSGWYVVTRAPCRFCGNTWIGPHKHEIDKDGVDLGKIVKFDLSPGLDS